MTAGTPPGRQDPAERSAKTPDARAGTQAIDRAMAVLRLLIEADGDVQVTEIIQRLGLTPAPPTGSWEPWRPRGSSAAIP